MHQQVEPVGKELGERDRYRRQSHDRPISTGMRRGIGGCQGVSCLLKLAQCRGGGAADIEAIAGDGIDPVLPPAYVSPGLVVQIPADFDDAVPQRQGHARVIGPFARLEPMRPPRAEADHLGKRSRSFELDSGPQRIADREPQECPAGGRCFGHQ